MRRRLYDTEIPSVETILVAMADDANKEERDKLVLKFYRAALYATSRGEIDPGTLLAWACADVDLYLRWRDEQ